MNINVDVRISHWTSNAEPSHGAAIEITDEASRKRIVAITLTPEQFYNLIANRGAKGEAEVLDPEHYANVGMEYVYQAIELPSEISDRFRLNREVTEEMHALGEREVVIRGMQGYRWTRHNDGWGIGVWRYE